MASKDYFSEKVANEVRPSVEEWIEDCGLNFIHSDMVDVEHHNHAIGLALSQMMEDGQLERFTSTTPYRYRVVEC